MIKTIKTWRDAFNNDITLYEYPAKGKADNILLVGRFHGDEAEGDFCLQKMLQELPKYNWVSSYNIYILPCLNPSGKKLLTRANGHNVDLNRNYPTENFSPVCINPRVEGISSGMPASEIETQIMMEIIQTYDFKRILSIHSDLHLIDYDGPARELALKFSELCGYRFVDEIGYPTNGSFGTWAGVEKQIPLITVETWHAENEDDMLKIWQELKPAIWDFCKLK